MNYSYHTDSKKTSILIVEEKASREQLDPNDVMAELKSTQSDTSVPVIFRTEFGTYYGIENIQDRYWFRELDNGFVVIDEDQAINLTIIHEAKKKAALARDREQNAHTNHHEFTTSERGAAS